MTTQNIQSAAQVQNASQKSPSPLLQDQTHNKQIIIGLMVPFMMVILDLTVFGVALPAIRDYFQIRADVVGWLVTAYTLPFMISMPLYGRLGDELGKRRLLLVGITTFLIGTTITSISPDLRFLMAGRAIQGLGAASVVPLAIAIISEQFALSERGRALGLWNSIGPVIRIASPFLAGLLIDYIGWRVIFGPVLVVGGASVWAVKAKIPQREAFQSIQTQLQVLRRFDWGGVFLLVGAVTMLTFYLSSPAITGVTALQDWRLLGLGILFFGLFIFWEKRRKNPYVALNIFSNKMFSRASFTGGIRMFSMSGVGFLIPLYLADIYSLSASAIGIVLMIHAGALLITMRLGGQLADRWASRWPVTVSMVMLVGVMLALALLPYGAPMWVVTAIITMQGFAAGLSLAPLHRVSMIDIAPEQTGMAAGLYSMARFTGSLLGPVIGGVLLQYGLDTFILPVNAYQLVFGLVAGVTVVGVISGWSLSE